MVQPRDATDSYLFPQPEMFRVRNLRALYLVILKIFSRLRRELTSNHVILRIYVVHSEIMQQHFCIP